MSSTNYSTSDMVVMLHFDDPNNPWKDECGNKWRVYNSTYGKHDLTNYKFGKGCYHSTGYSYLYTTDVNAINIFNGDFTIEFWVKIQKFVFCPAIIACSSVDQYGFALLMKSNNTLFFDVRNETGWQNYLLASNIKTNYWYYITFSRVGTKYYCFFDGNLRQTLQFNKIVGLENKIVIGSWYYRYTGSDHFYGYIDELRILKKGIFTSSFTPPKEQYKESTQYNITTKRNIYHLYNISYDSLYYDNINNSISNITLRDIHNKPTYNDDTSRNILRNYIYNNNNIYRNILKNYIYNNDTLRDINKINNYDNNTLRDILYNTNPLYTTYRNVLKNYIYNNDTYRYIKRIDKLLYDTKRNINKNKQVLHNTKRLIHNNINIINYIYRKKVCNGNNINDTVRSVISWKHKIIAFITNPRYKLR